MVVVLVPILAVVLANISRMLELVSYNMWNISEQIPGSKNTHNKNNVKYS
jgi:hypothetical protein